MSRCPYCEKTVWRWQAHPVPGLHQWCLDTFLKGYAEGVKIAVMQAVRIVAEHRKQANIRVPDSQMVQ